MIVLGAFPERMIAEIVERCLIRNWNSAGQVIENEYKYHNPEQRNSQLVLDDIPWFDGALVLGAKSEVKRQTR